MAGEGAGCQFSVKVNHLHMEFLPPDAIQIVENKEVTCRMISLAFQENTVQENKVRMLIPRDEQGQIVVAAHPYDLARLCYS